MNKLQFSQKRSVCKFGAKEGVVFGEFSTIKKPSTLHLDNSRRHLEIISEIGQIPPLTGLRV